MNKAGNVQAQATDYGTWIDYLTCAGVHGSVPYLVKPMVTRKELMVTRKELMPACAGSDFSWSSRRGSSNYTEM